MRARPIVAIDGPSGVGKSTVARGVAAALGFAYVDTGALYRAVALAADGAGVEWSDGPRLADLAARTAFAFRPDGELLVDGVPLKERIRSPRMSFGASVVSKHKELREALLHVQRKLGADGGVVLEGRDIGTVVFPDAEVKIFLTASARVRAERRFLELAARGEAATLSEVERDQATRDAADERRAISPLRRAPDAVEVRCDDLAADEVVALVVSRISASFPLTSN